MNRKDALFFLLLILVVVLFFVLVYNLSKAPSGKIESFSISSGSRVGVLEIEGVIISARPFVDDLQKFTSYSSVKALVIRIDSPGGGVAASQEIYSALKKAGEKLPVVVSMGGVAASGGYYVAVAADTIVANPGTTTGSIGVIATLAQVFRLMDKIGIDHEVIKSGKFKDSGSALRKMTPEDRQYLQGWIDDAYQQFVETVAEERNMPLSKVKKIADGRVFTGRQALELGLIDKLGDFQDAIDLAGKMGGIKGKPEILEKKKRRLTLFDLLFGDVDEFLTKLTSKHIEFQYIMP